MANILDKHNKAAEKLFTTNFLKVLRLYINNPNSQYYGSEVAKKTCLSKAGANFALNDLYHTGFLRREKKGRLHLYSLAMQNPTVKYFKIISNIMELESLINDLKKYAVKLILYGSASTGENTEESDIDILILTRNKQEVEKKIAKSVLKEKIRPVIHTPQEWAILDNKKDVFTKEVNRGIVLWESDE